MPNPAYQSSSKELFELYNTSLKGLSSEAIAKLRTKYGWNELTQRQSYQIWRLVVNQFISPLVIILIIAGAVSLFLKEPKDAIVIFAIILINAIIGFIQELQAAKSIDSLKTMIEQVVRVVRDGQTIQLESRELLPGDIVVLQAGDKVPADIRLIEVRDGLFDEAALTGESVPVAKITEALQGSQLEYTEQTNMAFAGTLLVRGQVTGVVVAIGDQTVIGKISQSIEDVEEETLPVQRKINRFSQKIGIITATGSLLVLIIGVVLGLPLSDIFRDMVAVLVASVPEGLPIVVTVTLAIGVQRMAKAKAVIRHLPAVETLGSTTVIGTDKTGTLTKNEMTVTHLYSQGTEYSVTGEGYATNGQLLQQGKTFELKSDLELYWSLLVGVLCNDSRYERLKDTVKPIGDPTEVALHVVGIKAGIHSHAQEYELIDQIPFDSSRYYMASLYRKDDQDYILVKGSPEIILDYCDGLDKPAILDQVERFSQQGLRVLAMLRKSVPRQDKLSESDIAHGFTFCGLQAMIDPPRHEVVQTIKRCKQAGIRVVMITGDHAVTASAIGKQVGIIEDDEQVITGKRLKQLNQAELDQYTKSINIFARVSPEDKLRIVESLKRNKEIIAVTGDGVNDAPALKSAHIGVAMGKAGTDAAREAADMVILDDNFTSIVKAVEQGRIVFENIRRVALYLVPTGVAAIITVLFTMLLGLPIPYTPIQLLWINLVASGLQDITLAFEPGDGEALKRKPLSLEQGIMSGMMLRRTILVGGVISLGVIGLYTQALRTGLSIEEARSLAMTVTVLFQFFQVWNVRSDTKSLFTMNVFSNPLLFVLMVVALLAQLAVLYIPSLQGVFGTFAINLSEWIMVLLVASSVVILVEIDKAVSRSRQAA